MFESLLPVLQGLINATKAMASFDAFRKAQRGEARALIEELKENSRLCFRVVADGVDHRAVIPGSVLAGAFLLLIADTVARTLVAPAEMPVGLLTSILGAPWFLWLIFRRGEQHG